MRRYLLCAAACVGLGCGGGGIGLPATTVRVNESTLISVNAPDPWTCTADRGGCVVFSSDLATYSAPPTPGSDQVRIYHRKVEVQRISIRVQ